jgi:beta-1,4-mannosyl-glycoprotein beta-1,4-N-acetylglucosaminyltransferase
MELWDYVDIFVVVEADKTFDGTIKPFYAEELIAGYSLHLGKQEIRYIKVTDMPEPAETTYRPDLHHGIKWNGQFHQRNAIMRGLYDLTDEDIIMISDVDEIWDPTVKKLSLPFAYEQLPMTGYLNIVQTDSTWYGTMAIGRESLIENTPQDLRMLKDGFPKVKGGWHFSWCGGEEAMLKKAKFTGHTKEEIIASGYDPDKILDHISRMQGVKKIDIASLPKFIRKNTAYLKEKGFIYE